MNRWTDDEIAALIEARDVKRMTWRQCGVTIGRSRDSVRSQYRRLKGSNKRVTAFVLFAVAACVLAVLAVAGGVQ